MRRRGAITPFGWVIAPLGDFVTREKKRVASGFVQVMRTLICAGPTIEIGIVKGADSRRPLWPGIKAGLNFPIDERTLDASPPPLPMPGSALIALGIPPIG